MSWHEIEDLALSHQLHRQDLQRLFGDLRYKKTRQKIAEYLADENTQLMHSYWKEVAKRLKAGQLDYFDLLACEH